jgi:hypothetical protein
MDLWTSVTDGIATRLHGPLKFRLLLQPTMAALIAIRAGLKDAREGRPVYFWAALTNVAERGEMIREGWKQIAKLFVIAAIMDAIYQIVVHSRLSIADALLVAVLLAVLPYLILRGLTNRIARLGKAAPTPPR